MDPIQFGVALILVTVGFCTYYVVPYAFFNQELSLVFTLLNLLLVLIIIGLTLICVLIFPMLEQLLLWITLNTCCRRDKRFHSIVEKNMQSHRKRNSKTSILFTLAIAFLIFAASSFNLIAALIEKTVLSLLGADLYGIAVKGYMNEVPIAHFLDEQKERGMVDSYAFVCTPASQVFEDALKTTNDPRHSGSYHQYISDISQYNDFKTSIQCVPENFLSVTDLTFYYPKKLQ